MYLYIFTLSQKSRDKVGILSKKVRSRETKKSREKKGSVEALHSCHRHAIGCLSRHNQANTHLWALEYVETSIFCSFLTNKKADMFLGAKLVSVYCVLYCQQ